MVRLSVSAALPGVRPDLCGWHLCRLQKKTFCDHRRFLYEMWETAGGYTAGILPGLQQKAACIPAKSCAAVLSGTGKIVIVSDEICKPSGLCRNLRQGKWQFDWDHGFAGARLQGSYRCRCTENGSENAGTIKRQ